MINYEGPKYHANLDNFKEIIEMWGVAIIPNILNSDEIDNMRKGTWEYLETVTKEFEAPIKQDDKKTWKNIEDLFPLKNMQIQHWKIGHAQYVWDLRQNSKILKVFSRLWNKEPQDLLVSFDGAGIHLPPEITKTPWESKRPALHCDQKFSDNSFKCVQSWVNAYDTNKGDATLAFYEKSHLFHKDFAEEFGHQNKKDDWHVLDNKENDFYIEKCGIHKSIECPAGSLVMWDSRLIHCGQRALEARKEENIRSVVFLCYAPRSMITDANLKKRKIRFKEMRMTSHWPTKVKLFPKKPNIYNNKLQPIADISKPVLNEMGLRLVGY